MILLISLSLILGFGILPKRRRLLIVSLTRHLHFQFLYELFDLLDCVSEHKFALACLNSIPVQILEGML